MKIPKSVRIAGVEYAVQDVPHLNDGTTLAYGYISYIEMTISLTSTEKMSHEKKCLTLWHEILHGIRKHAGLEIKDEEKVVDMFAKGVYQVLQDNGRRLFDIRDMEEDGGATGEPFQSRQSRDSSPKVEPGETWDGVTPSTAPLTYTEADDGG
jgi:hypothetical protein